MDVRADLRHGPGRQHERVAGSGLSASFSVAVNITARAAPSSGRQVRCPPDGLGYLLNMMLTKPLFALLMLACPLVLALIM